MGNNQNKFKSPVLWGAIAALALTVLVNLGIISPTESEALNNAICGVFDALVLLGIWNNPSDSKKW